MIEINQLQYKWPGQSEWLLDIQKLQLNKGSKLFVTGASGSGKTTLLNLLGGVLLPQKGTIVIHGTDLTQLKAAGRDVFRAEHMGYIFQQFNLVPYLTVLENVMLPCWFSRVRMERCLQNTKEPHNEAIRLLEHLGLSSITILKKQVSDLSVGQQQRVAAARAFIGSPEIIIADEPTSALDAEAQKAFIQLLFKECEVKNTTLLYVSHDTRLKNMFDDVFHICSSKPEPSVVTEQGGMA